MLEEREEVEGRDTLERDEELRPTLLERDEDAEGRDTIGEREYVEGRDTLEEREDVEGRDTIGEREDVEERLGERETTVERLLAEGALYPRDVVERRLLLRDELGERRTTWDLELDEVRGVEDTLDTSGEPPAVRSEDTVRMDVRGAVREAGRSEQVLDIPNKRHVRCALDN